MPPTSHSEATSPNPSSLPLPIDFWKSKLKNVPYLLLPCDYPRTKSELLIEGEESLAFSEIVCRSLLQWSLQTDLKPFSAILTSLAILLHKYCGEEDVIFGSSSSTFNPLVLRVNLSGQQTLKNIVETMCVVEEEAYQNDIPFDILLDTLQNIHQQASVENSVLPLFQVRMFNVVDVNSDTLDSAFCDWTFYVEQIPDSKRLLPLNIRVVYNTTLYTKQRMSELLNQLEFIVHQILVYPDRLLQDTLITTSNSLSVLPNPSEKLDSTWFGTVHSYLTMHAERHPDRIAIFESNRSYTYEFIDKLSNRLANCLLQNGIQKEDVVALYAHRSAPIVFVILGILKAGATFTVVDPAYPPQRQITYLSVSKPKAILCQSGTGKLCEEVDHFLQQELLPKFILENLDMEVDHEKHPLFNYSWQNPDIDIGPNNIGTLSFTSGSSGIPKAVRGRHISLTHFYPWMQQEFHLSEHDRFTMLSGIAHDPIQRDIFTPLFLGASIHIPPGDVIFSAGKLAQWCADEEITIAHLTPAMGQLLTSNASALIPSFRCAFFVGDVLMKRDALRLRSLAPNISVINMYGTTETQRSVSYHVLTSHNLEINQMKDILPSGKGMKDVQLLILKENNPSVADSCSKNFHMCGIGELGEIFVRSHHLAAGYLGLPEETKKKFMDNPFTQECGDRLYRTGDLGRYMPNGIVECVGRCDFQVKIRGFRIELGEIDSHLGEHPHVRENVTLVKRDSNEEKLIVSYIVPSVSNPDLQDIRNFLKEKLPVYSIPSVIFPISQMPITLNGKIDRNRLPFPDLVSLLPSSHQLSESNDIFTPLQERICKVWKEVLGRTTISLEDNFFEIGGHSILATRLTFELRESLKSELPLNILYENPTISSLSHAIETLDPSEASLSSSFVFEDSKSDSSKNIDLLDEVHLPTEISSSGKAKPFGKNPDNIFITGVTGFLGAFLLKSLLRKFPSSRFHCLVRAKSQQEGFSRIVQNLECYLLWESNMTEKIVPVIGDLSLPKYGLSDSDFSTLGSVIDIIFHNGALVHWVYPYKKLKGPNVNGTVEALRLASIHRIKPIHFISSTSVFDSPQYLQQISPVLEDDNLEAGVHLSVGYGQTKWVAEKLVMLAGQRGIPYTIFRPGYIGGHSETGVLNTDDYLIRLIKGCIELKQCPRMLNRVNICPVDFVADSIAHVSSLGHSAWGFAYHFVNPEVYRFSDFFSNIQEFGFDMEFVDYLEWRESLMKLAINSKDNALYPLLHFVMDDLPTKSKTPLLDNSNLISKLSDSSIQCPPISSCMGSFLSYLVHVGYLQNPPSSLSSGFQGKQLPQNLSFYDGTFLKLSGRRNQ